MGHLAQIRKIAAGIGVVGALTAMSISPAFADDSVGVSQTVTAEGGTLAVAISEDPTFTAVSYQHAARTTSDGMQITVDDTRGTGAGWVVSAQISGISTPPGVTMTENDFDILNIQDPALATVDSGQPANLLAKGTDGDIGSGRALMTAESNEGQGQYVQEMDLGINLPAGAKAGTYSATLTVTIVGGAV